MTDGLARDGWVLGVDLGTSHTVAMLRRPDGRTRPLLFDGQPLLPSAVYLDTTGRLHVGRDAVRLGQAEPGRLEPNPKRHVDAETVLLGGADVPTADLLAALLGAVAREAVAAAGFLPPAVLTYPAAWGTRRRAVLTTALARAGWPPATQLLPEPVAAARYFADVLRRPVPVGSALAVFDFGGGTLDIAVVRNEGITPEGLPRFAVAASGGIDDLGGLDLDAALVEHLGAELRNGEPAAWTALTEPVTLAQWRARRQFWDDVRGAKEMLSRTALAPVPVPGVEHAVHLTRDEFEAAAGPLLRRGVAEAEAVIRAAGVAPTELAGLFLVGGSSRVPLVARLLHSELGIAPTVLEQPELPVAEGATIVASPATPDHAAGPDHAVTPAEPMRPAAVVPIADTMAHSLPGPAVSAAAQADDRPSPGRADADEATGFDDQADLAHGAAGRAGSGATGPEANGAATREGVQHSAPKSPLLATEAMEPTAAATDPDIAARSAAAPPATAHADPHAVASLPSAGAPSAGPQTAGPQRAAAEPQRATAEPQRAAAEPQRAAAEPQRAAAEPQRATAEPQRAAAGPQGAGPQAAGAHAVGPQGAGPQAAGAQAAGPQARAGLQPPAQQVGGQQGAAEPQYAEPVDPWATGEAAAFGNSSGGPILHPVSGAPISASPVSTPPEAQSWLASTHPEPGDQPDAGAKLPAYKRKGLWIVAAATVVVLGVAATVTVLFWPRYAALDYQPLGELHRIKSAVPVTTAFSETALRDGRAYFASVDDQGTLGVVAAATDTGKTVWSSTAAGIASRWEFFFALPDAVVAISDTDSITSTRRLVLLDPGDGKKLWDRTIDANDDVVFAGEKAVLVDRREGRLVGLEIGNRGNGKWELKSPKSQYDLTTTKVVAVTTGADFAGPASAGGVPFAEAFDDDQRIVQIGADDSARVIDADSGAVVAGPRQSVAKTDDKLIAHDGRLIVAESTDAHRLFSYDLAKLEPKVLYTPPTANTRLDHLTPCGTDRICVVETAGYATDTAQVVAVDSAKGGVVWRRAVADVDRIVPVGEAVLATADTSPVRVSLLDAEGRVSWTRSVVVGRIDAGNMLQFSKALSTSADDPALAGEHLGDDAVPLGSLDGVRSSTCTWDSTHLACVAAEDFVIQRFAG